MKLWIISIILQVLIVFFIFPVIDKEFRVSSDWKDSLVVVLLIAGLNIVMKAALFILTVGIAWLFNKLTLGLAGIVLNSVILLWVSRMMPEKIKVPNFLSAFIGAVLLSAANALVF